MMVIAMTSSDIITIIGFALTIATFYLNRKSDTEKEVEERTKMYGKIDKSCTDINEVSKDVRVIMEKYNDVTRDILEHRMRLEQLEKKFEHMEKI